MRAQEGGGDANDRKQSCTISDYVGSGGRENKRSKRMSEYIKKEMAADSIVLECDNVTLEQARQAIKDVPSIDIDDDAVILSKEAYSDLCLRASGLKKEVVKTPPVEPKPVCEDAISKKWLEDNAKEFGGYYEDTVYAVPLSILEDAPSVIPKRPKGEWTEHIDDLSGERYGLCPLCKQGTLNAISYDLTGKRHIMNFCPNCGADMRGDKE